MMHTVDRPVAGALIWSADGLLLLGLRRPGSGGPRAELWQAPGGGVAEGESPIQAVTREIAEETGLVISSEQCVLIDSEGTDTAPKRLESGETVLVRMSFSMFEIRLGAKSAEISVNPGEEFSELRWFTPEELKRIEIVPAGVELLRRLEVL